MSNSLSHGPHVYPTDSPCAPWAACLPYSDEGEPAMAGAVATSAKANTSNANRATTGTLGLFHPNLSGREMSAHAQHIGHQGPAWEVAEYEGRSQGVRSQDQLKR